MSLWDKQQVWHDRILVTKSGATLHLHDPEPVAGDHQVTLCGHWIGKNWHWTNGPVARYRTCDHCRDLAGTDR